MDAGSSTVLAGAAGERDKLSSLGDAALGHILSFLPASEAARTATLSRRWRHVFAAVHTLSFEEAEDCFSMGYPWWRSCSYCDNGVVLAPTFVAGVSAALLGHNRRARRTATAPPLRALRVVFDEFGFRGGDDATKAVDAWLSYAVLNAGEVLEVELRLGTEPICQWAYALNPRKQELHLRHGARNMDYEMAERQDDDAAGDDNDAAVDDNAADAGDDDDVNNDNAADADDDYADENSGKADDAEDADTYGNADSELGPVEKDEYVVPRSLFTSCAVLRTLRLGRCRIDPPSPSAIELPLLHTLHLTRVTGLRGGGAIQRLVSACSSLVDLTLEACEDVTALSLRGARLLRRLALRCCHQLATVVVDGTPELQALEYRGAISPASLLTMRAHASAPRSRISFCAFDLCGVERGGELLGSGVMELLAGVERLHLTSARLGGSFVNHLGGVSVSPWLPMLRSLEMTGMVPDDDESVVSTVARILEGTPRLETLSLFFLPEPHPVQNSIPVHPEVLDGWHELRFDPHARLAAGVPPPGNVEIPSCLRETTKEINLVHYQGSVAQRALAKFLLCNAAVVDEVCWKVARGPLSIQTKLMEEVRGWVMNKSANMIFF